MKHLIVIQYSYFFILLFFIFIIGLSIIILSVSFLIIKEEKEFEKNSPYECGFSPFDEARNKFDIRFYLIGILFIIFDLEIAFLFPWSLNLSKMSCLSFYSMIAFLIVLTIGFIYEWQSEALEWE